MKFESTALDGVVLVEPRIFGDHRGFFMETYHKQRFAEAGIGYEFVQDNHSRSCRGTLRGLHYQLKYPQGKLIRVVQGEVWDVAVDIRRNSPGFGRWVAVELSESNRRQLFVPPGFAHGFCVTSETAEVIYKCTELYHPEDEQVLLWNDPELAVAWPVQEPILSAKDLKGVRLADALVFEA